MLNYDALIIGSGFAGAVVANRYASLGKKVLMLEQRNHIGGNCYDHLDENGILIHKYGPHIFHTNNERVYKYILNFTKWYDYSHEVVAFVNDEYIPVPFNLNSLHLVFEEKKATRIENKLINIYGEDKKVPILELMNNTDEDIKEVGEYVYNNVFLKYTMKQWGQKPEEVDPSVTARVPVLISRDDRYFTDKYQGMPLDGYTLIFENMLYNPNIDIKLETNGKDYIEFREDGTYVNKEKFEGEIIYTGPIDELFDCKFGRLPYRTLQFEFECFNKSEYQPKAVVNYTVSEEYTRITEFKKLTNQKSEKTTIMKEFPKAYEDPATEIPYYAILSDENFALYNKYKDLVDQYKNFHLLGRLAEYKYYNIDAIVEKALLLADDLLSI